MLVYGPNKASSLSSIEAWLKPTASLAVRGEKLGRDPQIGQSACWRCSREFLFLGSSGIHPNLSLTCERLLYTDYVRYIWPGSYADRAWKMCGVLVGFFPTGCISI
jgi:hypothetical protein